jgi:protein-S-isoprenylcysteine O-methyltransferase Ste14
MYTAILGWAASVGFLAANWAAVVLLVGAVAIILAQIPRAEEMMIGQFGDDYRE